MKNVRLKTPAKFNLTLDVVGVNGKYHEINSLVTSVNVYDVITVKKRKDDKVVLTAKGLPVGVSPIENNAYKAARLFVDTFHTEGADVIVEKHIPVGGGMGGSSADIAGVLKALNELYETDGNLVPLANELGSDAAYMLHGGYAVMSGRGDVVTEQFISKQLFFVAVAEDKMISARNCYKKFDRIGKMHRPCTASAVKALLGGDFEKFCAHAKNDLYPASESFLEELKVNGYNLKRAGAPFVSMTGSGSVMFGAFETAAARDAAYEKLRPLYGKKVFKTQTVF